MATVFETEPCDRCGGTGKYSFNGEHSRCYKCDGKNGARAYTKRGKAAKEYYNAKFQIAAKDVTPGMVIRLNFDNRKFRVVSVEETFCKCKSGGGDWQNIPQITLKGANYSYSCGLDQIVRRLPTTEENEIAIADALRYQSTL